MLVTLYVQLHQPFLVNTLVLQLNSQCADHSRVVYLHLVADFLDRGWKVHSVRVETQMPENFKELGFNLSLGHCLDCSTSRVAAPVIGILLVRLLHPSTSERLSAFAATEKHTEWKVRMILLVWRHYWPLAFEHQLSVAECVFINQRFMLASRSSTPLLRNHLTDVDRITKHVQERMQGQPITLARTKTHIRQLMKDYRRVLIASGHELKCLHDQRSTYGVWRDVSLPLGSLHTAIPKGRLPKIAAIFKSRLHSFLGLLAVRIGEVLSLAQFIAPCCATLGRAAVNARIVCGNGYDTQLIEFLKGLQCLQGVAAKARVIREHKVNVFMLAQILHHSVELGTCHVGPSRDARVSKRFYDGPALLVAEVLYGGGL